MSRKRRIFDIDVPEGDPAVPEPDAPDLADAPVRRGPMAAAIVEAGASARARAEAEAAIRAENDALAHEFVRLKRQGLVTDLIPLDQIWTGQLTRDRLPGVPIEMDGLVASIRAVGLSNPIRVVADGPGRYGLVQGLRRLTAYRMLLDETGDPRWARIPAALMAPGETLGGLYRRMVDENLVRKDVSLAEMAALARAYADEGVEGCADLDEAVNRLYASAAPQKRSYIRRFALVMRLIGDALAHPWAIARAPGLALADRFEADPASVADLLRALDAAGHPDHRSAEAEQAVLRAFLEAREVPPPARRRGAPRGAARRGRLNLSVPVGPGVRATATAGKVELRAEMDFASLDRLRLEAAIEAFFAALTRP